MVGRSCPFDDYLSEEIFFFFLPPRHEIINATLRWQDENRERKSLLSKNCPLLQYGPHDLVQFRRTKCGEVTPAALPIISIPVLFRFDSSAAVLTP
jgi:hypothetical protein